jgi:3'-phosphoadenosine 5'-phosphosulfate sulfotransferase (PAPS reductase)/FAD synthetase
LYASLKALEAEAIYIMREVAASFESPCMFYSIGKDSTMMRHKAQKAFAPDKVPFTIFMKIPLEGFDKWAYLAINFVTSFRCV